MFGDAAKPLRSHKLGSPDQPSVKLTCHLIFCWLVRLSLGRIRLLMKIIVRIETMRTCQSVQTILLARGLKFPVKDDFMILKPSLINNVLLYPFRLFGVSKQCQTALRPAASDIKQPSSCVDRTATATE